MCVCTCVPSSFTAGCPSLSVCANAIGGIVFPLFTYLSVFPADVKEENGGGRVRCVSSSLCLRGGFSVDPFPRCCMHRAQTPWCPCKGIRRRGSMRTLALFFITLRSILRMSRLVGLSLLAAGIARNLSPSALSFMYCRRDASVAVSSAGNICILLRERPLLLRDGRSLHLLHRVASLWIAISSFSPFISYVTGASRRIMQLRYLRRLDGWASCVSKR